MCGLQEIRVGSTEEDSLEEIEKVSSLLVESVQWRSGVFRASPQVCGEN